VGVSFSSLADMIFAMEVSIVKTRIPGDTHPPGCWQVGTDEMPSSPQNTHKAHKDFTMI
jgi:hypothetical protein